MNVLDVIFKAFGVASSNLGQLYVLLVLVVVSAFLMPLSIVTLLVLLN